MIKERKAQINITYTKKLQDNTEKRKQPDRQRGRKECKNLRRGNSPVQRQQRTPRRGLNQTQTNKICGAEKAPGGIKKDKEEEKETMALSARRDRFHFL